jgi:site-specific recombinase
MPSCVAYKKEAVEQLIWDELLKDPAALHVAASRSKTVAVIDSCTLAVKLRPLLTVGQTSHALRAFLEERKAAEASESFRWSATEAQVQRASNHSLLLAYETNVTLHASW